MKIEKNNAARSYGIDGKQQKKSRRMGNQLEETMIQGMKVQGKALLWISVLLMSFWSASFVFAADYTMTVTPVGALESGQLRFQVDLDQAVLAEDTGGIYFDYAITAGDAEPGDYSPLGPATGHVVLSIGEGSRTFLVDTTDDSVVETDETVIFTLTGTGYVAAPGGTITTGGSPATAVIGNDDNADLSIAAGSGAEGAPISFTVTSTMDVEGPATISATVTPTTEAGDTATVGDYNGTSQVVTIASGNSTTISIDPVPDSIVEADETFTVTLVNGLNANAGTDTNTGTITDDDLANLSIAAGSGAEGGGPIAFVVTSSVAAEGAATITAIVTPSTEAGDTATAGDYNVAPQTVTIANGNSATIYIDPVSDSTVEVDETFTVTLVNGLNANAGTDTNTGTITNDDLANLSIAAGSGAEGGGPIPFVVTSSVAAEGAATITATVTPSTETGDTAAAGDYNVAPQTVTIANGNSAIIYIDPVVDAIVEGDETFTVTLVNGTNANAGSDTNTGTITNDDLTDLSISAGTGTEDGGSIMFTVTSSLDVEGSATVTATVTPSILGGDTAEAGDYVGGTQNISISSGNSTTVFIDPVVDTTVETDETFTVTLTNGTNAIVGSDTNTGTITNDDLADLSIAAGSGLEGGGPIAFVVTSSLSVEAPATVAATVTPSTEAGDTATAAGDYNVAAQAVSITSGNNTTVYVAPIVDTFVEGDETFTVTLTNGLNANAGTDTAPGTISNDDTAEFNIVAGVTVDEGMNGVGVDALATFSVVTGQTIEPSAGNIVVDYSSLIMAGDTASAADHAAVGTDLTFSSATPMTQTFTVGITNDLLVESDESYSVQITMDSGPGFIGANSTQQGIITNDEQPTLNIDAVSFSETDSGVRTAVFFVSSTLQVADNAEITFDYDVDIAGGPEPAEASDVTGALSGTGLSLIGSSPTQISVDIVGDEIVEKTENFRVDISNPDTLGTAVDPLGVGVAAWSEIINDDTYSIAIAANESAFESAGSMSFDVVLSNPVEWSVDPSYAFNSSGGDTALEGPDYTDPGASPLTFAPGVLTQTISVSLVDDTVSEVPDEIFTITLSDPTDTDSFAFDQRTGTGTIRNDDHEFVITKTVDPTRGTLTVYGQTLTEADTTDTFTVYEGDDAAIANVATDTCYHIQDWQLDGTSMGSLASYTNQSPDYNDYISDNYTVSAVDGPHTVNLDFAINTYTIETQKYGGDGSITATAELDCNTAGPTITATADTDFKIIWFKVDGARQAGAYGLTTFSYTLPANVTQDHLIEVAFSVKVTLLHDSPFGSEIITVYNNDVDSGIADGTVLTPDEENVVYVDYDAEVRFGTLGEAHTVQGPDYIMPDPGIPVAEQFDDRSHQHHLSLITDNGSAGNALCGASFTDSNYRSDPTCQYVIPSATENHGVEILYTGFVDVSAHSFGDILALPEMTVTGSNSGLATGTLEFEAGDPRVITFDPAGGWYVQSLDYKETTAETPAVDHDPGLTGLSRSASFTVPADYDVDHGLQVTFSINQFTITAVSTFEELLFYDAAMTDKISVENDNIEVQVPYKTDQSYYVLINDLDFAVVGVSIDNTLISLNTIKNFVSGTETNPDSAIYDFSITTVSGNEILEIVFKDVDVSHNLEIRDYDNVIISDLPLDAQVNPNPPALMFVTDDSGSMDWEFIVNGASSGLYSGYYYLWSQNVVPDSVRAYPTASTIQDAGRQDEWKSQWSGYNTMYYNPGAVYDPWPTFIGTIDHDNDVSTPEINSKLPDSDVTGDNLAHANIYRPRHHAWHKTDCIDALTMANNRVAGTSPTTTELEAMRTVCDNGALNVNFEQTFDMDKEFQAIAGGTIDEELQDEGEAARAGSWTRYTNGDSYNNDYFYNNGTGSATYSYTPTETTAHTLEVSWRRYDSRSENVPYRVQCNTCIPVINVTVTEDQTESGYYDDGMVTLGSFNFEAGKPVTIKVGPTVDGDSQSIDGMRLTWVPTAPALSSIIDAHYYTFDDVDGNDERDTGESVWLVNLTDPITYSRVLDDSQDISAVNLDTALSGGDAAIPTTLVTYASPTDSNAFVLERQNFADWYSYYRTRSLAATSAVALSIGQMSNVEVGIHTINYSSSYGISQSALPVKVWGKRNKSMYLHYLLYAFEQGQKGTPLRSGHKEVAQYFDATDGRSGTVIDTVGQSGLTSAAYSACGDTDDYLSPFAKNPADDCKEKNGDRCKISIAILVTDGYWNGYFDGSYYAGSAMSVSPDHLEPVYNRTLAGTAYDYRFTEDLMDDTEGDQQYMITYGVAFGLNGSRVYKDSLVCTILDDTDCPSWPLPVRNTNTTIDDLWHASVAGDGKYLNADSPTALVDALKSIVSDIEGKEGSSASLAVNGDELYETIGDEIRMYQASWNTTGWTGDLKSYDPSTCTEDADGTVNLDSCEKWSAMETLDARTDARVIASYDPWKLGVKGIPFDFNELGDIQKSRLFPSYAPGITDPVENVVDFLRGDVLMDPAVATQLRSRANLLGDIVNSQGRFQRYETSDTDGNAPGSANWEPTYEGVIFVGANDGMLHAFSANDADQGKELFAYVPGQVYRNLRDLADPDYKAIKHKMFVDSTPYTATISYGSPEVEKTILVGGLGKGGKGYYALDVTDAHLPMSQAELAGRVLWEYPPAPDDVLADTLSRKVTFTSSRILFDTPLTIGEMAALKTYRYIEIIGANDNSGILNSTNDGIFEIEDADGDGEHDGVATDGTYIQIASSDFATMVGVEVTLLGSTSDQDMGYSFSRPIIVETNDPSIGLDGWVVIFGNGYGSENGDSVLYILDPLTGEEIETAAGTKVGKIYTTQPGIHGGGFSGLATPKVIDVDNDLKSDYVYAGDLLGNMWKFDLRSIDAAKWQVAFCDGSSNSLTSDCVSTNTTMIPQPLFSTDVKQPITSAPDIMRHPAGPGYMVIFGSGKYLGWLDLVTTDMQSLYGVWDWAPDTYDGGYHGARADNVDTSVIPNVTHVELTNYPKKDALGAPLNSLLKQVILLEGYISEDTNGNGSLDPSEDTNNNGVLDAGEDTDNDGFLDIGEDINGNGTIDVYAYYRIPSAYEPDWRKTANSNLGAGSYASYAKLDGPEDMSVPLAHLGWVFDLTGKLSDVTDIGPLDGPHDYNEDYYDLGERMVNDTIIRDGKAIMITFGLNGDKCGSSAYSFLNERNAETGGMLYRPNYDIDGDGDVDWDDTVAMNEDGGDGYKGVATDRLIDGRVFNPVIIRNPDGTGPPSEDKYISGSALGQGLSGAKINVVTESAEILGVHYWQQVQ